MCWATQWASKGHPGCTGVHQEKGRKLCHCWQLHEREALCGLHLQFPLSVCHCCATYFENRPSQSNNTLPHPETTELSLRNSFIIPSPHATPRGAHHQDLKHDIYIYIYGNKALEKWPVGPRALFIFFYAFSKADILDRCNFATLLPCRTFGHSCCIPCLFLDAK